MEFCPKCGGMLVPKKEGEELKLVCSKCGHAIEKIDAERYKLVRKVKPREEEPAVVEERRVGLPTTRALCPKCGHDKAYWWLRQTRGADEPTTRFHRCVKCGHTWREY